MMLRYLDRRFHVILLTINITVDEIEKEEIRNE
jgi:hypothetical protein